MFESRSHVDGRSRHANQRLQIGTSGTDSLIPTKFVLLKDCDRILAQFEAFLRNARRNEKIIQFNRKMDSLDKLFHSLLHDSEDTVLLWNSYTVRILLTLSHGQATVERGFSINRETVVVNLGQHNLIAKRVIKDYVGGVENFVLSESLLKSARQARQKYEIHLKEQQSQQK